MRATIAALFLLLDLLYRLSRGALLPPTFDEATTVGKSRCASPELLRWIMCRERAAQVRTGVGPATTVPESGDSASAFRSGSIAFCAYTGRMKFSGDELVALLVAVSFSAGLNVYATVATLGLLMHAGVLGLPPSLELLGNWWVIGASGAMFGVEFFADKIPAFDLIWNALHTFIRIPVAALLAYQATAGLSPGEQLGATLAGGAIAMIAHGGKTAARTAVTVSPEPISNITLSMGEDAIAVFLTWFGTRHPYWAAGISAALVALILLMIRWVVQALKGLFGGEARATDHSRQTL